MNCSNQDIEDVKQYQNMEWWMDGVGNIIICSVGIICNLLSIPVLLSRRLTNVFYRTLAALALFDTIFLMCDLLESIRRNHYPKINVCANPPPYQTLHLYLFPVFLRPLQSIMMVASIYATIVVALGRYLAVAKPISTMVRSGKGNWKTVMMYLMPVLVFSVFFKLPIFWEFYSEWCDVQCLNDKPVDKPRCESIHPSTVSSQDSWEDISDNGDLKTFSFLRLGMNEFRLDHLYILYYVNVAHLITTGIFPVGSLIVLNYLVYSHLVERRRQAESLGIQTQSHHFQLQMRNQITLENRQVHMLFGVVILFFVGYALRFVLNVNELHSIISTNEEKQDCPGILPTWIHVVGPLQRLLLAISHSGNLFIYCVSSDKFREILLQNICKSFTPSQIDKSVLEMDTMVTQPLNSDHGMKKMNGK